MMTDEDFAPTPDPIRAGLTSDDMSRAATAYDRLLAWAGARDNVLSFSEHDADDLLEHIDRLLIEAKYVSEGATAVEDRRTPEALK